MDGNTDSVKVIFNGEKRIINEIKKLGNENDLSFVDGEISEDQAPRLPTNENI